MGVGFCPQLAVGGTSCISLVSVAAADENSLTPLHRLLPTETASLGFGGNPVGGGDKTPVLHFFGISVWGWYHYPPAAVAVSEQPRAGLFQQKKRLSQSGCSAPMDACCSLLHTVLFWHLYAWGGITTLGVRFMLLKRWTRRSYGGVFAVLCRPGARPVRAESPLVGYTRHPSP